MDPSFKLKETGVLYLKPTFLFRLHNESLGEGGKAFFLSILFRCDLCYRRDQKIENRNIVLHKVA